MKTKFAPAAILFWQMIRSVSPVILLMAFASILHAQTSPAPAAPDLSSPKAALASVYTALKNGDIDTARGCLLFKDAAHADVFDITHTQLYRPMRLMHAMEARFGPAGGKPFANAPLEKSLDDLLEKTKAADIQITGDAAVVADKKAAVDPAAENELTGIRFQKQAGQWKIVDATFTDAGGGAADLPAGQLPFMRALRDAVLAACQETELRLARGDYQSADQAFADYQSRLARAAQAAAAAAPQKQR